MTTRTKMHRNTLLFIGSMCLGVYCLAVAVLLSLGGCGGSEPVDVIEDSDGRVTCSIVCDYSRSDGVTEIRAEIEPGGSATCESCDQLLQYHAARFSCEDGAGRNIVVKPLGECS